MKMITKPKMMFRIIPRQSVPNSYDMYIYDDVTARGRFDWSTWKELESETSNKFFREKLAQIPGDATINLYINSNGGEVKEGVGIYNQLKRHGATVNGVVDGNAYSVAFLILMACDHRTMNLGTSALVHNMWTIVAGNANDLRKEADALDKLMESNRQIFLDACGGKITEEKLMELMDAETFLTPDECLEYGFIDEVNRFVESAEGGTYGIYLIHGTFMMVTAPYIAAFLDNSPMPQMVNWVVLDVGLFVVCLGLTMVVKLVPGMKRLI
jgi:ATP-dependent protease ClpP protease subunit